MRNGPSGIAVDFWMEDEEVKVQQLVRTETGVSTTELTTVKTLRVRWGEELRSVGAASKRGKDEEVGGVAGAALKHLVQMIAEKGIVLPADCGAPIGLRGLLLETWRGGLIAKGIIGGQNPDTNFGRVRSVLQERSRIEVGGSFVWLPML